MIAIPKWFKVGPWTNEWDFVESLGTGGQSHTCQVIHRKNKTVGPLKVLKHPDDKSARARMFREVALLKSLDHQGIPKLIDSNFLDFESSVTMYSVLEFIPGQTLAKFMEDGLPDALSTIAFVKALLEIVETVHDASSMHRDIKPQNIILRQNDISEPVLIDFGIAASIEDETMTRAGETIGNRFLQLPEFKHSQGDKRDQRSDLSYCCGILFFCLTGLQPEQLLNVNEVMPHKESFRAGKFDSLPLRAKLILESIFDTGFQQHIDRRFQTAKTLRQRLEEFEKAMQKGAAKDDSESIEERIRRKLLESEELQQRTLEAKAINRVQGFLLSVAMRIEQNLPEFFRYPGGIHIGSKSVTVQVGVTHVATKFMATEWFDARINGTELVFSKLNDNKSNPVQIGRVPYSHFEYDQFIADKVYEILTKKLEAKIDELYPKPANS